MQKILQQLSEYQIRFPEEKSLVGEFEKLINEQGNRCLFRDCFEDGHIVGSLFVTNLDRTKLLLMHHLKFDQWQQFGGHADGEEDIQNVAIREFHEESGNDIAVEIQGEIFDIDIHTISAWGDEPVHKHYDIRFLGVIPEIEEFSPEAGKVGGIKWLDTEEILDFSSEISWERILKKL